MRERDVMRRRTAVRDRDGRTAVRDRDVDTVDTRTGRMQIPRSRGALSGVLLVLLGLWGALAPFIGPYVNFAYEPNTPWTWTTGRGWLEVLPGAVTVLGGLLLLMSRNRATAMLGGWLAVVGGAWFVVGRLFATPLGLGDLGAPVLTSQTGLMALELAFFTGLGTLIVAIGAMGLGRLSVRSLRDIRYVRASVDDYRPAYHAAERETIARERVPVGTAEPVDEYRDREYRGDEYRDDVRRDEYPDTDAEDQRRAGVPVGERRHRGLRGVFGGSRHHPIPH